jgi:hypothetical protein
MSEGSFWPKTWGEAVPLMVWGVLIFAAGFELISTLVHGEWIPCGASFILFVGMSAVLIHWRQVRQSLPLAYATGVLLIIVALSPYIEQQRWPFSAPASSPGVEAAELSRLRSQNDQLVQERDTARQERDQARAALKRPPDPRTEIIGGPYEREERGRMILALATLHDILNLEAHSVEFTAAQLENNWQEDIQRPDVYFAKMDAAINVAEALQEHIARLLTDNSGYRQEFEPAISGGKEVTNGLVEAFLEVRGIVEAFRTIDDHQQERMQAVSGQVGKIVAARSRYREWAQRSSANVDAKLKRLREIKP